MKKCVLVLVIHLNFFSLVQGQAYMNAFEKAKTYYQEKSYSAFLTAIKEANCLRPNHQTIMYYVGTAYALNQMPDSALYWLKEVMTIDAEHYPLETVDLENLKKANGFAALKAYRDYMKQVEVNSDTALVIAETDIHLEDIAYDALQQQYLATSINKRNLYKIDQAGNAETYFNRPFPLSLTGITTTPDGKAWVSAAGFIQGGLSQESALLNTSKLYRIDLAKQKLLDSMSIDDGKEHVFGDVYRGLDGEIYVSDSKQNAIYKVQKGELKLLKSFDEVISLQGITQLFDRWVVADYVTGLWSFNPQNGEVEKIGSKESLSLKGIDGLYNVSGDLVIIQNGVAPNRVTQLHLNKTMNKVSSYRYLEKNHPAYGEPTLGFTFNNQLFYLANSFWPFNQDGEVKNEEKLKPVILKLPIHKRDSSSVLKTMDYVEILEGNRKEALYFYENNWAKFRAYAAYHGYIKGFRIQLMPDADAYDIVLETEYADSTQLIAIEEHFSNWIKTRPSPDLLNDIKPDGFRKNVKHETFSTYLDAAANTYAQIANRCQGRAYRAFDFWLGDWEVYNKDGIHIGHNTVHLIEMGCGIQENWRSNGGTNTGSSYNFYDAATDKWYQSWVSANGVLRLSGTFENGKMVMTSDETSNAVGESILNRITWTPIQENEVEQRWEVSNDGGKTWSISFLGYYRK